MKYTIITVAAALLMLSSCGIYGKYSSPVNPVSENTLADDLDTLPSWREVFADPCLQALVDTALRHNTDLQLSLLKISEAEAALKAAGLSFLPQASATASYALPSDVASLSGSASWQLDIFGKLRNEYRRSEMTLEQSRAASQAVRTALVAAVADGYFSLLALDSKLEIYGQTLENWEKTLTVLEALKLGGRSNDVAILQSRARKLSLEASVVETEKNVVIAENALRSLLGVSRETPLPRGEGNPVFPFEGAVSLQMLAARPDVRASEMALSSAYYGTASARSSFYPTLTISGGIGTEQDFDNLLSNALASLLQPLFQRGKLKADLEVAVAREKAAYLSFRQILLDAGYEVADALASRDAAVRRLEIDDAQISALSDAEEKVDLMMRYTSTSYLEVLNAKQSLLDARLVQVGDRCALQQSIIRLYEALGGGID